MFWHLFTLVFSLIWTFSAFSNEASAPQPSPLEQFFPFILIGLFFYFILIRPQQKRQKNQVNFLSQLKEGDEILTTGGIYGKILRIMDQYVLLELDKNIQIRLLKACITSYAQEKHPEKEQKTETKKNKKRKA